MFSAFKINMWEFTVPTDTLAFPLQHIQMWRFSYASFVIALSAAELFPSFPPTLQLHYSLIEEMETSSSYIVFISCHLSLLTFLLLVHYSLCLAVPLIFSLFPPVSISHAPTWHICSHLLSLFSCSLPSACPLASGDRVSLSLLTEPSLSDLPPSPRDSIRNPLKWQR